jgi:hypothetical protein
LGFWCACVILFNPTEIQKRPPFYVTHTHAEPTRIDLKKTPEHVPNLPHSQIVAQIVSHIPNLPRTQTVAQIVSHKQDRFECRRRRVSRRSEIGGDAPHVFREAVLVQAEAAVHSGRSIGGFVRCRKSAQIGKGSIHFTRGEHPTLQFTYMARYVSYTRAINGVFGYKSSGRSPNRRAHFRCVNIRLRRNGEASSPPG